jgi:hypothetical protein
MSDTTTWKEYCEASLDLSNQDDVGEAGAIAAWISFTPTTTKA